MVFFCQYAPNEFPLNLEERNCSTPFKLVSRYWSRDKSLINSHQCLLGLSVLHQNLQHSLAKSPEKFEDSQPSRLNQYVLTGPRSPLLQDCITISQYKYFYTTMLQRSLQSYRFPSTRVHYRPNLGSYRRMFYKQLDC